MEKLKCKCIKGLDGFTWGKVYDVEFAGRVWWAVNDDGKRVSGATESFDPIEEPVSEELEEEYLKYVNTHDGEWTRDDYIAFASHFANWQKHQIMKDAVEGELRRGRIVAKDIQPLRIGLNADSKFKLIITKEK